MSKRSTTKSDTGRSDHSAARAVGVLAGLMLAALAAKLSLHALNPSNDGEGIVLLFAAIGIGAPLSLLTLGFTLYLAGKGELGPGLFAGIWLPVAASLAIIPVAGYFKGREKDAYASTHRNVNEVHVNLTGRDLQFDPLIGSHPHMAGKNPDIFMPIKREPVTNRGDRMAAYRGVLLAPDFKSMSVIYGPAERGETVTVPVMVAPTPVNWAPFLPELSISLAEHLVHYYYHYPDRVEVASAINWNDRIILNNGLNADDLRVHNLTGETVVRLEVNGETVSFYSGLPTLRAGDCRVLDVHAVLGREPELKVRWQTAQSPTWREATPTLPSFREPTPEGRNAEPASVHLFLRLDGRVTLQRTQPYYTPEGMARVLESEALPPFVTAPVCGTAADQYAPRFEKTAG